MLVDGQNETWAPAFLFIPLRWGKIEPPYVPALGNVRGLPFRFRIQPIAGRLFEIFLDRREVFAGPVVVL